MHGPTDGAHGTLYPAGFEALAMALCGPVRPGEDNIREGINSMAEAGHEIASSLESIAAAIRDQ